jgi:hypothetical protein
VVVGDGGAAVTVAAVAAGLVGVPAGWATELGAAVTGDPIGCSGRIGAGLFGMARAGRIGAGAVSAAG